MDGVRSSAVADRSLAVIAEIEEAVGGAKEARVRSVQGAVHLLRCGFLQDARLGSVCIAVTAVLQVRDHETGHVRGAGLHSPGRHCRWLTQVTGEYLKCATFIRVSDGCIF